MNDLLENPTLESSPIADELAKCLSPQATVRSHEPLARRTTLRVGGPADLYVEPASEPDLAVALKYCAERELPFFLLGRGSNLLVRDGGFHGVVICLAHPYFSRIEITGTRMDCGAGAKLKHIAVEAKRHRIAELEFLEGIPGSLGGGLCMNAGAMGGSLFDRVESVRLMDFTGVIRELPGKEMGAEYRGCPLLRTHVALGAVLSGRLDSHESIAQRMIAFSRKRWTSQPAAPSAGCIFKNPVTIPAGRLIDELGLKGTRIGGAMVSVEHGNFIVTDGTATARDVLELIQFIQQRAKTERNVDLHTEVEMIGEE
jgi:UDP-N-acetylenolpyruvoylglucosamine reductase